MKRAPKPSGRAAAAASVESVTNQTAATSPLTQSGASSRGPGNYLPIPPRNAPRTSDPEPCNSPPLHPGRNESGRLQPSLSAALGELCAQPGFGAGPLAL